MDNKPVNITGEFVKANPGLAITIAEVFSTSLREVHNNKPWSNWHLTVWYNKLSTHKYKVTLFHPVNKLYGIAKFNEIPIEIYIKDLILLNKNIRLKDNNRISKDYFKLDYEEELLLKAVKDDYALDCIDSMLRRQALDKLKVVDYPTNSGPSAGNGTSNDMSIDELYGLIQAKQAEAILEVYKARQARAKPKPSLDIVSYNNVVRLLG